MAVVLPPQHFDELADWLLAEDIRFSAAELHGAISGCLSGGLRLPPNQWPMLCQDIVGAAALSASAMDVIAAFVDEQLDGLGSNEMGFSLFLPDEDVELDTRAAALTQWCRGFLGGFAEAQSRLQKLDSQYEEAVRESLGDLASIAQLDLGDELEDSDDSESDLIHLIEHAKLAALTVFTEIGWVEVYEPAGESNKAGSPNTLH